MPSWRSGQRTGPSRDFDALAKVPAWTSRRCSRAATHLLLAWSLPSPRPADPIHTSRTTRSRGPDATRDSARFTLGILCALGVSGCGRSEPASAPPAASTPPTQDAAAGGPATRRDYLRHTPVRVGRNRRHVFAIDADSGQVVETIPSANGRAASSCRGTGKELLVALSGSPIAGPGVDESKLPPADRRRTGSAWSIRDAQGGTQLSERPGSRSVRFFP